MPRICPTLLSIAAFGWSTVAGANDITRVSADSAGLEGNLSSYARPSISDDGRFVAFESDADNLVDADTNEVTDVFVRDRQTGTTSRVSVDSNGIEGDGGSLHPSISGDGRFVAFTSGASNLVAADTNGFWDVFVHDRQTGAVSRVSVAGNGIEGNHVSAAPSISSDGRYVAFFSAASNLVAGDNNSTIDVFVRDRQTGTTTRVSVASNGAEGDDSSMGSVAISGDGRFVAFYSLSRNLVAGDTNGTWDVFLHDRQTATTVRVSVDSSGAEGNGLSVDPSISGDGRFVAFDSAASNLVAGDTNGARDVFVYDRETGTTARVSLDSAGAEGGGGVLSSISDDGRYVAFESLASNLVSGDTNGDWDVFVRDLQTGKTRRVSKATMGAQANGASTYPSISGDGQFVAFVSTASNLVLDDTNEVSDAFVERPEIFGDDFEYGSLLAWSETESEQW